MRNPTPREAAADVLVLRTVMVNVFFIRDGASWVLVDAGIGGFAGAIQEAARTFIGRSQPPRAIVLTHGHFDHVGSLRELLRVWNVPVLAHALERPYLTGRSPYPPPDPLVGRGSMALLSRLYPRGPFDFGSNLQDLAADGAIPELPGWRWIHTPGHCAGHVALFRDSDRTLLAGDALTTTKQESAIAVAMQRLEMHGPPAYFTQDWDAARRSVQALAALEPETLASGHGEPWRGAGMRARLHDLAANFDREVPAFGRYVREPAVTDERGIVSLPPDPLPKVLVGAAVAAAVAVGLTQGRRSPARRSH